MKLEYLSDGSPECPLLRLYEFNRSDAQQLWQLVNSLVTSDRKDVPLQDEMCQEAGLPIRRKKRRRLRRAGFVRPALTEANQEWAMDFVHDAAESGRKFRVLSVIDVYTRKCLGLEVDTGFPGPRMTRVLETIMAERGAPEAMRCDNGPEFTSRHFLGWALEKKIEVVHIEPGKPVQNAHVESFHGKLRDECLNASWFGNWFEARAKIGAWKKKYNEERPHSSLGYLTPAEFARRIAALRSPTAPCEPQCQERNGPEVMCSGEVAVV